MSMSAHTGDKRVPIYFASLAMVVAITIPIAVALLPPLPEPQVFRGLADNRTMLGIPNFLNVVSNFPFLLVGVWALIFLSRVATKGKTFADRQERWPYFICFLAVGLTCFGSIYYHLETDSARLFWDRLPMAVGFMALFSAVIVERIDIQIGLRLLFPLVLAGLASVLYWRWSLLYATENLLPYALVQYGSILAIVVIAAVYPSSYTRSADMFQVVAIYACAKVAEVLDAPIYAMGGIVSGHTLKHLIAALAAYWLLRMLRRREVNHV